MRQVLIVGAAVVLALAFGEVAGGQDSGGQRDTGRMQIRNRPRIGVSIDIDRGRPTDSIGAYIVSVSPGSPAEKAGIQPADVITKIGSESVVSTRDPRSPGLRLISLASRLEPNVPTQVELRRGNARKTLTVVPAPNVPLTSRGLLLDSGGKWSFRVEPGDSTANRVKGFFVFITSPWAELETASLNPELGAYFGASEGVLITRVPSTSKLGLKGGDVVLAVNGQKPADPAHFMRIVQGLNPDETVKLRVLRHQQRMVLNVKLTADAKP